MNICTEAMPQQTAVLALPSFEGLPDMPRTLPLPNAESLAVSARNKPTKNKSLETEGKTAHRKIGKVHKHAIRKNGMRFGRWDAAEHRRFLEAMEKFGNSWKLVCDYIKTRTADQIRSHAQKYYEGIKSRLIKEMKEDPSKKKSVFVVTREYWNTNGLSRASLDKNRSPNKGTSNKLKTEASAEKCTTPTKEAHPDIKMEPMGQSTEPPRCTPLPAYSAPVKFPLDSAWLMLAHSCAYANSMLLSSLQQYNNTQFIPHNP